MKKISIPAVVILILALIIAIGSQTFIGPCVHEDGSVGACHWAGRGMLGIGILLAALSLLALMLPGERRGLFLAMVPAAIVGILTPGTLISICMMSTMRCRALMRPAMLILCALTLVMALVGWLNERRKRG